MALKALMLSRRIEDKKKELVRLREKDQEFETREKELETAIGEAVTDEEKQTVSEEVETFDTEKASHDEAKSALETEIEGLEQELAEIERKKPDVKTPEKTERRDGKMAVINIRSLPMNQRAFDALPMENRAAILEREDMKSFLVQIRSYKGQERAVQGTELTIPIVILDLIAENMYRYSKLLHRVRVRPVNGVARQTIAGTIPEAVWTEMCGALNELSFGFNQVSVDGFKVGGFIPVCNSILDDSDVNLASWIVEMLSESIGLAMDKAILYGKGAASKMPLGIVTRLAQTSRPSDYPANAPDWVNLSVSNIVKVDSTKDPVEFWADLAMATGNTFTRYSRGRQFWAMNSRTYAKLRSKLITFTASGDLVARFPGVMPIIDGDVDVLEFMPDGDIIGGYGDLYLLALRAGMVIESSREVQFIQDNTVFKATERADGQPVIPGAFVAININNVDVTTVMDFVGDKANDAQLLKLVIGNETMTPEFNGLVYAYTITASAAADKVEATSVQSDAKIAISYKGENVKNGGTVTWEADGNAHPLTVTVKNGNAIRVYTVNVTKASA